MERRGHPVSIVEALHSPTKLYIRRPRRYPCPPCEEKVNHCTFFAPFCLHHLSLAPDWKRIKIREIKTNIDGQGKGYAHDFANLPMDVDEDGFADIVTTGKFGGPVWFENVK